MILLQVFRGIIRNIGSNGLLVHPLERLLLNDIDIADKLAVFTDRHIERSDLLAIQSRQILNHLAIGNLIDIHIRYKEHSRKMILLADLPCLFGSCLDSGLRADHDDGTVGHRNRFFYFSDKIKVSGGIQNVQLIVIPLNRDQRSMNGNFTLLLLLGKIADGASILNLSQSRCQTTKVCHRLDQCCLSAASVSKDYDVADLVSCINFHVGILQYVIEFTGFIFHFPAGSRNILTNIGFYHKFNCIFFTNSDKCDRKRQLRP